MSALDRMASYDDLAAAGYYDDDEPPQEWSEPPTVSECDISAGSDRRPDDQGLIAHRALMSQSIGGPPELPDAALYGLAGELVRLIDPQTEADPAAVLVTVLAAIGNLIGPSPHVAVGATKHGTNLFALVVGATAKARKGTSLAEARRIGRLVDPEWEANCITSGIASGEGLIALVADPGEDDEPRHVDKRAFVAEEEFARLLSTGKREGSTVSPIIRSAWDGRPLKITTKQNSLTASGHLISVVGHITADEMHNRFSGTDIANGLVNRFLIVFAQRSKLLPSGGRLRDDDLTDIAARVRDAVHAARKQSEIRRTKAGDGRWDDLYETMADDDPGGLVGAVTARSEPQVLRLALIFALLDSADSIDVAHLDAAWAVWSYCRASAEYLFGDALGDPIADRIDAALKANADGLDRTALRDLFGRHVRAGQMDAALDVLRQHKRITETTEETAGRPRTIYRSATKGGRP